MRTYTDYLKFQSDQDTLIIWFWKILESFDQDQLASFLFFITGSLTESVALFNISYLSLIFFIGCSKLPAGGFKDFRVKLLKSNAEIDSFPIAHTCFNQIDLPEYSSEKIMKEKII